MGVTGYVIYRNGGALVTLGNQLSYSDNSVSGGSTYTYFIKAFDARGNFSGQSSNAIVTTPSPVVTTSCPAPATNAFTGCYYNNTTLAGNPVLTRTDSNIVFSSSPLKQRILANCGVIGAGRVVRKRSLTHGSIVVSRRVALATGEAFQTGGCSEFCR